MNMFIINCKNYEINKRNLTRLLSITQKISQKYKIKIAIAPPQHLTGLVSGGSVTILTQHVDNANVGSTTGYIIPELLKKSKINGSLINHSEHRIPSSIIKQLVPRLRNLGLLSILCVKNLAEVKRYVKLNPDYIAIEPPELIGSGKAISQEQPELITNAVSAVNSAQNSTKLLCGAGIISGYDVLKAMELGADGILVASGIIKAKNWNKIISDFTKSMI